MPKASSMRSTQHLSDRDEESQGEGEEQPRLAMLAASWGEGGDEDAGDDDGASKDEAEAEFRALQRLRNNAKGLTKPASEKREALRMKLDEIYLDLPFIERLDVTAPEPLAIDSKDANDDLKREAAFYAQALSSVTRARAALQSSGVPYLRPEDYFAEMVKSDDHMRRIKESLLFEQRKMAAVEQRKKNREQQRFGKQLKAAKIKSTSLARKGEIERVKEWQRSRIASGNTAIEDDGGKAAFDSLYGVTTSEVLSTTADALSSGKMQPGKMSTRALKRERARKEEERRSGKGKQRGAGRSSRRGNWQSKNQRGKPAGGEFRGGNAKGETGAKGANGKKKAKASRPGKARRQRARQQRG